MAWDSRELILAAASFLNGNANSLLETSIQGLGKTGATRFVNGARTANFSQIIIAIGVFHAFEMHFQITSSAKDPLGDIKQALEKENFSLYVEFRDLGRTINGLKHGDGWSYQDVLSRISNNTFTFPDIDPARREEGDVTAIDSIFPIDDAFIKKELSILERVCNFLGQREIPVAQEETYDSYPPTMTG